MILFSDFDGTLYFREEEEKTQANLEAIEKWRGAGHQFCITTGRSFRSVVEEIPKIEELSNIFIVDSGSIVRSKNSEILCDFVFDPEIVSGLVEFAKTFPVQVVPFYYTTNSEGVKHEINGVTKLRFWFKSADADQIEAITARIMAVFPVFAVHNKEAVSSYPDLAGRQGFIEVIPADSGKSSAIKWLQQTYGILPGSIVTVGDGSNDYGMIKDFNGFAIEGSDVSLNHPELKTTPSVAALIEQLLGN